MILDCLAMLTVDDGTFGGSGGFLPKPYWSCISDDWLAQQQEKVDQWTGMYTTQPEIILIVFYFIWENTVAVQKNRSTEQENKIRLYKYQDKQ